MMATIQSGSNVRSHTDSRSVETRKRYKDIINKCETDNESMKNKEIKTQKAEIRDNA